jgi:predicted dinucleotide-utilizing enzyme
MRGRASSGNAKTSNLTAWSAVRAIMNQVRPLTI